MPDTPDAKPTYVSRGGEKLAAALDAFDIDPGQFFCVDLGCNVGGFTDCLLQRGAAHVIAIDTGYGALAWPLRNDDRVTVAERTNAMHADAPGLLARAGRSDAAVDLAVIDLGWTPQRHAIPAALRFSPGHIISLIKPHYELTDDQRRTTGKKKGKVVLSPDHSRDIAESVIQTLPELGVEVIDWIESPVLGGAGKKHSGNVEFLAHLRPQA